MYRLLCALVLVSFEPGLVDARLCQCCIVGDYWANLEARAGSASTLLDELSAQLCSSDFTSDERVCTGIVERQNTAVTVQNVNLSEEEQRVTAVVTDHRHATVARPERYVCSKTSESSHILRA